jgi:hypothetical protein
MALGRAMRVLGTVTVALAAISCTSSSPPAGPTAGPLPLSGTIVAVGGASASIVRYVFPAERATTIDSPIGDEAANRGTFEGVAQGGGASAFVTLDGGQARAWRLTPDASGPSALEGALPAGTSSDSTLGIGQDRAAVATCDGVWTTSLRGHTGWERVGSGCWTAVGPSSDVALVSDGAVIAPRPGGAGPSRTLFRLDDLRRPLASDAATPVLVGDAAWDEEDGLAFSARAGDQLGVFVLTPDGTLVKVLQERYSNTFRVPRLSWQPGGGMLAIADDVGPGGSVLRLFDPTTGELRAAALDPLGFTGMEWSPDGTAIAILTGSSALLVVDPTGRWIARVKTDWKGLLAWTS